MRLLAAVDLVWWEWKSGTPAVGGHLMHLDEAVESTPYTVHTILCREGPYEYEIEGTGESERESERVRE